MHALWLCDVNPDIAPQAIQVEIGTYTHTKHKSKPDRVEGSFKELNRLHTESSLDTRLYHNFEESDSVTVTNAFATLVGVALSSSSNEFKRLNKFSPHRVFLSVLYQYSESLSRSTS